MKSQILVTAVRSALGGVLMGLANLVPGISGGTMLLASGIYPCFIQAIADITRCRFSRDAMLVLGCVVGFAMLGILLLAGPVKFLVVEYRWIMYSLFIGLTLGGVPVVWKLIRKPTPSMWAGAVCGFIAMAALAWIQVTADPSAPERSGWLLMLLAGVAGASAMILPGVSGGYLLLVLGVYVPILGAIAQVRDGLRAADISLLMEPTLHVILPVGVGVVVGVVVVSNVLRWLLTRFEKVTLGVLLGLLVGAVVGLYPFQQGVEPQIGDTLKGQTVVRVALESEAVDTNGEPVLVYEQTGREVKAEDYPTQYFRPSVGQLLGAAGLIVLGFGVTATLARISTTREESSS